MGRTNISSGSPFEPVMGFCRAMVVGDRVLVSGVAPISLDGSIDPDPEAQAARCLDIIEGALTQAGASLADVRPANTTVVVAALLNPAWHVEIEADAIIGART